MKRPLPESSTDHIPDDNSIVLEHVSYSYDGEKQALHDVSLSIKPGQTVALAGASGSGKTTLANIITRFFDPQEGRILIGNVDLRDMPKEALMNRISFVFQNSRLMKASILENVRMAKPEASRKEVLRALEAAQCMDIIEKLPDGIDTVVGTNGVYLSRRLKQQRSPSPAPFSRMRRFSFSMKPPHLPTLTMKCVYSRLYPHCQKAEPL